MNTILAVIFILFLIIFTLKDDSEYLKLVAKYPIPAVILILSCTVQIISTVKEQEGYAAPQTLSAAQRALLDVTSGKVKASKNSIKRVALTQVNVRVASKSFGEAFKSILNPSERVILRARPKYILHNNTIIVGKSFTLEATGKSEAEAKKNAQKKANETLQNITSTLTSAGLLS